MNKLFLYRRTGAILLMLLFTAAWSLRTVHGLFLHHHHHHEHPVCATADDHASKQHFHDEQYAPEDPCPSCAFWFSVQELSFIAMTLRPHALVSADLELPAFPAPVIHPAFPSRLLRGPPAL